MARAGTGDSAAFAALVDRHGPRVYALARRMLGSRAAAEDVVQDTFERAWRQTTAWRPQGARFSTWLHRVAYNLCLNHLGRVAKRTAPWDPDSDWPDPDASPGRALEADRQRALVRAHVDVLPAAQRTVVTLRYASELSTAQIAVVMDLSVKAVESLLARARRALRPHLQALREDEAP